MNHYFNFTTTYTLPSGELDPTIYRATLVDGPDSNGSYRVTVEGDKTDLYIEFTLSEVFAKWRDGEWKISRKN